MSFKYTFKWKKVVNTVSDRLLDDSLLHTLNTDKKINKQTKVINGKLKKLRNNLRSYKQYLSLKKAVKRTCQDDDETDDEPGLDHDAYQKLHNEKHKASLQKFRRSCTKTEKHEIPQITERKSPAINSEKSNKSRSVQRLNRTAISSSISQSDSEKTELAAVQDTEIVENLSDELAASEPQYDVLDTTKSCFELDNRPEVLNNEKRDNCAVIVDDKDDLNLSGSVINCREIPNKDNLISQEDMFMTDDEKVSLEENLSNANNDDEYIYTLNCDSSNNTLSDTDVLREIYGKSSNDKDTVSGYHDKEIGTKHCFSITEEKSIIPHDNSLELVEDVAELDGRVTILSLDNKFNFRQPELQVKNSLEENVELSDSNLNSETSQEITLAQPIHSLQLEDKLPIESTANDNRSKLKLRTIEQYDKGYEIFCKYQLHKQKKVKSVNNSDKKCMKTKLLLEDEQPLRLEKSSEDHNLSEGESRSLNSLLYHEHSLSTFRLNGKNFNNSMKNNLPLKDEEQSEDDKPSSKEYDLSEIRSHRLKRSSNSSFSSFSIRSYDEDFKNSVKTQLLSEIEQRLRVSSTSEENSPSHTQSQLFTASLHDDTDNSLLFANSSEQDADDELTHDQLMIDEDARSLESNESTKESNSSKSQPQSSNRFSNIEKSLLSLKPMPTKRRISSSDKDHCSLENTPPLKKLPRLHKQSTNRQLELISNALESQKANSHELELSKNNKDDSLIIEKEELNTCKAVSSKQKKNPRPRNLKEIVAIEALTQDTTKPYFRLKNIDEDDEIWIMKIPKTIDPKDLEDQMISLGGKCELRFGDKRYKISSKPSKEICNVSCIFATNRRKKQYKIVNIKSKGSIKFRQKFSVIPETELIPSKVGAVPFPKNLKIRHPLFGAAYNGKI